MSLLYRKKMVTRRESSKSNKHKLAKSKKRYDPFPIEKPRKERSNSLKSSLILCGICLDKKAKSEMYSNEDCSHSLCLECVSNYVAAKIRENVIKVKCPDIICKTYLDPRKCRSFVPQQVLDRWEAALCEFVLGENKIYCPFNDCSAPLIDDGEERVTSSECPHYHRLFCARCLVPWHAGSECKNKQGNREALVDRKFMELAKKEKWQRCPACNFYVQRKDGCECIKCRCVEMRFVISVEANGILVIFVETLRLCLGFRFLACIAFIPLLHIFLLVFFVLRIGIAREFQN